MCLSILIEFSSIDSFFSMMDVKLYQQTKEMLERKIAFIESKILSEKKGALEYKKNKNDRGEYTFVSCDAHDRKIQTIVAASVSQAQNKCTDCINL